MITSSYLTMVPLSTFKNHLPPTESSISLNTSYKLIASSVGLFYLPEPIRCVTKDPSRNVKNRWFSLTVQVVGMNWKKGSLLRVVEISWIHTFIFFLVPLCKVIYVFIPIGSHSVSGPLWFVFLSCDKVYTRFPRGIYTLTLSFAKTAYENALTSHISKVRLS